MSDDMCVCVFVFQVKCHSHFQNSLKLLQFGLLLLNLTVSMLTQFDQEQASDVQHFLEAQRFLPLNSSAGEILELELHAVMA